MTREAFAAALVAIFVFANSLLNGFAFDDVVVLRDNPLVATGTPSEIFAEPYWPAEHASRYRPEVTYRPVTILSFRANRAMFGEGAFSFHLVNVLLHAIAAALVTALAAALAGRRDVALAAGVLFAAHPVHVEAVANVVGRAELLAGVFWLIALLAHVRRPRFTPAIVFAGALAGFLSKEIAVTLPAAIAVVAFARGKLAARETAADLAAVGLAVVVFFAARTEVLGAALDPGRGAAYWDGGRIDVRLFTALVALARYALLFVFPLRLSADYSFDQVPLAESVADPRALAGLTLAAAAAFAAVLFVRRGGRGGVPAGVVLFAVAYAPVANVLFPVNEILAERFLYLPSVGLCVAVAAAIAPPLGRAWGRRRTLGAAILVLLAARSVARNEVWRSDDVLFEHTVRDAPRCARAWNALGSVRAEAGRAGEAEECFRAALAIQPGSYPAHDGLGHLARERGDWSEALAHFAEAARTSPAEPAPLYNAGIVHLEGGNPERAVQAFEAALRVDPSRGLSVTGLAAAWHRLAVAHASSGRLAEAEQALDRGIARVTELGGDVSGMEAMREEVRAELGGE